MAETQWLTYEFGPFTLDTARRECRKNGELVKLRGKPWTLLLHLLESAPRHVPDRELYDVLWPREAGNLEVRLKNTAQRLRQKLGDDADSPAIVRQIDRHYVLLLDVTRKEEEPREAPELRLAALFDRSREIARTVLLVFLSPRAYLSELGERPIRRSCENAALVLLLAAAASGANAAIGGFGLRAGVSSGGQVLGVGLFFGLWSYVSWRAVRAKVTIGVAFAINGIVFGSSILAGMLLIPLAFQFLSALLPGNSRASALPTLLQSLPIIDACLETSSASVCADASSPFRDALVTVASYVVLMGGVLIWWVWFWTGVARFLGVGFIRSVLAYSLFNPVAGSVTMAVFLGLDRPEDCRFSSLSTQPILNPGPLTFGTVAWCADFPLVDVGVRGGTWSRSQQEHNAGLAVKVGDVVTVRVFVENGAGENAFLEQQTTARGVKIKAAVQGVDPTRHSVSVVVESLNAPVISSAEMIHGGDAFLLGSTAIALRYLPGTAKATTSCEAAWSKRWVSLDDCAVGDRMVTVPVADGVLSEEGLAVGDLKAGYKHALQVYFQFLVEPAPR